MSSNRGGSGGVAEPGGTGVSRIIIGGNNGPSKTSFLFRRSMEVNTVNYANKMVPSSSLPVSHNMGNEYALITSLGFVNANNLEQYMHGAEYNALPDSAWAKRCRVTARPLSYRTSFETASTNVGAANSQMPVNIIYAVGLNKYLVHGVAPITATDMVPTNTVAYTDAEDRQLWTQWSNGLNSLQSPAIMSYCYFPSGRNDLFSQDLSKYVKKENLITAKGHKVIDFEYNFKVAPLKKILNPQGLYNKTYNKVPLMQQIDPKLAKSDITAPSIPGLKAVDNQTATFSYYNGIEKAQFMTMEAENSHTSDCVPGIYIGGQGVLSSMPGVSPATFSKVYIQWELTFELEVVCNINYMDINLYLLPHFNPWVAKMVSTNLDKCHVYDSGGHQFAFINGRFYNTNKDTAIMTMAGEKPEKKNTINRAKRNILPELECEESIDDFDDSEPVKKVPRGKYKGVLKENEGITDLFDM